MLSKLPRVNLSSIRSISVLRFQYVTEMSDSTFTAYFSYEQGM